MIRDCLVRIRAGNGVAAEHLHALVVAVIDEAVGQRVGRVHGQRDFRETIQPVILEVIRPAALQIAAGIAQLRGALHKIIIGIVSVLGGDAP